MLWLDRLSKRVLVNRVRLCRSRRVSVLFVVASDMSRVWWLVGRSDSVIRLLFLSVLIRLAID